MCGRVSVARTNVSIISLLVYVHALKHALTHARTHAHTHTHQRGHTENTFFREHILYREDDRLARVGLVHSTSGEGGTWRKSAAHEAGGAADAAGISVGSYLHPKPQTLNSADGAGEDL
jgi:hypothetical protein